MTKEEEFVDFHRHTFKEVKVKYYHLFFSGRATTLKREIHKRDFLFWTKKKGKKKRLISEMGWLLWWLDFIVETSNRMQMYHLASLLRIKFSNFRCPNLSLPPPFLFIIVNNSSRVIYNVHAHITQVANKWHDDNWPFCASKNSNRQQKKQKPNGWTGEICRRRFYIAVKDAKKKFR